MEAVIGGGLILIMLKDQRVVGYLICTAILKECRSLASRCNSNHQ